MVRLPRFFGKKRGHRRTGSQAWASLGDGVFHAVLLLAGIVFGGLLVSGVAMPQWRINHDFTPTTCTVLGKGLLKRTSTSRTGSVASTWQPCLRVRYLAAGRTVEAWSRPSRSTMTNDRDAAVARLSAWRLGDEVSGWFDPAEAGTIVLERGYNWWMWLLALMLPGASLRSGDRASPAPSAAGESPRSTVRSRRGCRRCSTRSPMPCGRRRISPACRRARI